MSPTANSFLDQVYSQGAIDDPIFSLCFTPADPASKSQTYAGFFVLGGSDVSQHAETMDYASLFSTSGGFYGVETRGIALSNDATSAAGVRPASAPSRNPKKEKKT